MADPFLSQLMGNSYGTGSYSPSAVETQYSLDPNNTIIGARPLPKLTLPPLSPSVNTRVSAMRNLSTIKNDAWADPNNGWAGFWNGVKNAGISALNFLDRGHQAVDSAAHDVLTGNMGNIGGDVWGSLNGSKTGASFGQLLDDLGWHQSTGNSFLDNWNNGIRGTVGFLGDVATDPLTYLTFGEGSIAKTGLKALAEFKPLAEADALSNGLKQGTKAFNDHVNTWLQTDPKAVDALHSALAENSKSLINFNIPFGPQASLVNKPAFLQKVTMPVNTGLARGLAQKMGEAGLSGQQRYDLMSHLLGRTVTSTKDLNTQEFDYLNKLWDDQLSYSTKFHFDPNMQANGPYDALQGVKDDHANLLNQGVIKTANGGMYATAPFKEYQGLTGFSPATQKLILNKDGELTKLGKVQEQFGKMFGSKRFVSIGSQMKNHATANGFKHVVGAHNWAWAHKVDAINRIKEGMVKSPEFKSLSPDEWKEVNYAIEGKRPSYAGYTAPTAQRQAVIDKVADQYRNLKQQMDDFEKAHGVTYGKGQFLSNYLKHQYNMPEGSSMRNVIDNLAKKQSSLYTPKYFLKARKGFGSLADLADFLHDPQVADEDKKLFANTTYNPAELLARRQFEGLDEIAQRRAIAGIKKEGIANKLNHMPNGWQVIDNLKGLEDLHGYAVPHDVLDMLTKSSKLLTNEKELNHFMYQVDKIMSVMRKNYTVTRAGFHARQLAGHAFHNALAGISPASIASAIKYMATHAKDPNAVKDWTHELLEQGILHTGESASDLMHTLETEMKSGVTAKGALQKANPFGKDFILGTAGRKVGTTMDNISRIAHYMHMRKLGMSKEAAADSVRKYLFNYNEINPTGRMMRTIFPFYQWMRNNLPLQLTNLVKNPKSYQIVQHFLQDYQQAPNADDVMQKMGIGGMLNQQIIDKLVEENGGVLPKYIQDNYVKLPWTDSQGNSLYYNLALPSQDVKTAISDPLGYFTQSLNPMIQALMEVHNNTSNLNGAPIDKFVPTGQNVSMTPAGMEYLANSFIGSPAQMVTGLMDLGMHGDGSNLEKAFGVNASDINNQQALNNLLYAKRNALVTRASQIKKAVTKQAYPNGYGTGGQ